MTAQILTSELSSIIQDSKRKHADIRTAAEKSLADLKSLPSTSEAQLASDLRRRPHFTQPFLLSCASKNPKLAGPAISCLQRLVVSNSLHPDALKDVLDAIRDCTSLAQDVQLRILQLLPSLLHNYGDLVVDGLLVTAMHICFSLLASKNAIVSNTAAATLQQLVVSVFDRVAKEDESNSQEGLIQDVLIENGWVSVRRAALDAHRLLNDVCLLIDGQKPEFLTLASLQANFGLEMVESVLSHHADVVVAHPELVHVLRLKLLPFIIRALSDKVAFSTTVRAVRLLPTIFSRLLTSLAPECEVALSLINHLLDPDASIPWKRVLCMELLRTLHADADLIRQIFMHFDQEEGRRNILQDQMATMVRVSSEKPAVIGLGQQSSVPFSSGQAEDDADEQAALQAEGISGTIGVAMTVKSSTAHGISTKISTLRIPCIDQVDKTEPPQIPPSYLYSLALTCMNNFSEGLAKFLLPFTVPGDSRSRRRALTKDQERRTSPFKLEPADSDTKDPGLRRSASYSASRTPANPLQLEDHPMGKEIRASSAMVDCCWPALLAAYSTFFHAALDSDYYRALVRSFQKFTQVSGLLRLETPRDAFLTTLSKNAMPSGPLSFLNSGGQDSRPSSRRTSTSKDDESGSENGEDSVKGAKSSVETPRASLNARNLLCLRALLNLGIALGPVLHAGWTIVLEALQQADFLINHVTNQRRKSRGASSSVDDADLLGDIGNEIAAVGAAATRMLESTSDLSDEAYLDVVSSLCGLFRDIHESALVRCGARVGDRRGSTSAVITTQAHDARLNLFVVDQITKLVKFNSSRILEQLPETNGWNIMTQSLQLVIGATYLDRTIRSRAAKALVSFVGLTASADVAESVRDNTRLLGLQEIKRFVQGLYTDSDVKNAKATDEDLHWLALESLRSVLELYGDSLSVGWDDVFAIVTSVFENPMDEDQVPDAAAKPQTVVCRSAKLMRSSFGSLQLICSDFLTSLPNSCLTSLMLAAHAFTDQQEDLNTSLTATTLYASVADLHWKDLTELHLDQASIAKNRTSTSASESNVSASISMRLFYLLVNSSTDTRMEVRHGAIYSLFRILEGHADKLNSTDWIICLKSVLITLLAQNQKAYDIAMASPDAESGNPNGWNETGTLLLENTSTVLGLRMPIVLPEKEFTAIWAHIISHMKSMLSRESLAVSAAVFVSLEKILSANDIDGLTRLGDPAWDLWLNGNPVHHKESTRKIIDNQPALMAYLSCFLQLHHLVNGNFAADRVRSIMHQIRLCATGSSPTAFAGDIDSLTPLQSEVLECIKALKTDTPEAFTLVMQSLSTLVTLPFETTLSLDRKGPTFVALSKNSMDLLGSRITTPEHSKDIYKGGMLEAALHSLGKPISLKYAWTLEGKPPAPWRKATTATVQILETALPAVNTAEVPNAALESIWNAVLESWAAIISTAELDDEPEFVPLEDLNFDIASAETIFRLAVPVLGSSKLSDEIRRTFAHILFEHSLVHEPHPDDLPDSYKEPLAALHSEHIGRTNDLPPSLRTRMSYTLLAMLFDLVSAHDGSSERTKLAQAAAPYLILRVSLTLKAYISDQPLRGRMPQPRSQRTELLWILRKLVELDSNPRAIPDAPGVASTHKKHLFRVVPLVRQALRVARLDADVHRALERVLDAISGEFGM